ncbi:peptide deformylase [Acidaminococcus sp.]|uniref:peptide deformylase n=1 Tax=Acidaminococcus sp. TaxID=1872103 RepID=UPI00352164D5
MCLVVKQVFFFVHLFLSSPVYAPRQARSPRSAMAANMIGVSKAIIVVSLGIMDLVMFNPAITQKKGPYETEEGCLSLTGTRKVTRYREIKVEFQDMKFKSRKRLSKISRQRLSSMNWIIWRRIDLTVLSAVDRYPAKQSQKNLEQARAMGLRD